MEISLRPQRERRYMYLYHFRVSHDFMTSVLRPFSKDSQSLYHSKMYGVSSESSICISSGPEQH